MSPVRRRQGDKIDGKVHQKDELPANHPVPRHKPHFNRMTAHHPTTIFDSPRFHSSEFYGFYVFFWVVVGVSTLRVLIINFIEKGWPLTSNVFQIMQRDLVKIGFTDLCMYLCMYVTYGIQVLVKNGFCNWSRWGWIVQHIWQTIFVFTFLGIARFSRFPWIGRIFLTLHMLVQVMKQHSYAVFNGHLHQVTQRLEECKSEENKTTDLLDEISHLEQELNVQSRTIRYPANLNIHDFFMYTMFPTCVYELEYPRRENIRWGYLFQKVSAVFGVILTILVFAEQYMYPLAMDTIHKRELPLTERLTHLPMLLLNLFPPFAVIYILNFYLIWDAILNSIAEITRFDDREFYRDWWNSVTWDKFARDWNIPVHNFLARHVYRSSILFFRLSKPQGMIVTFFLSSLIHELAMYVIFGRFRGYLFLLQLSQLPLQFLCSLPFVRTHQVIGITLFWFGIAVGPSILCSLYLML